VAHHGGSPASDLDIVVVAPQITPHWATHEFDGWPIEVFALTPDTYRQAFVLDRRRRWPLHLNLCRGALVVWESGGLAQTVRAEAQEWYEQGPDPLSEDEIADIRYRLTWMLDDLGDAAAPLEVTLAGYNLAEEAADAYLLAHRCWLGRGKWRLRQLEEADASFACRYAQALAALQSGDRSSMLEFGQGVLQQVGGRGFAGRYFAYCLD
jgi:hypothetical protein